MNYELKFNNKIEIKFLKMLIYEIINKVSLNKEETKICDLLLKRIQKILDKKPIRPSSRKSKGRNLQKYVCERLAQLLKIKYDQQDDTCPIHSREMGQSGVDIVIRNKDILKKFPYAIECKNVEKISINKMITQSEQHLEKNKDKYQNWLVFYKNNKLHYPLVILDVFEFFKIYEKGMKK
jgi:hypothetical protein